MSNFILDMFRKGATAPHPNDPMNTANPNMQQQQQQPQQQQQQPQNNQQQAAPQDPAADPSKQQSPEVDLSKLWTNDPNNKGPADPADFRFNVNQEQVNAGFGKLDFTRVVSPELLGKIKGGGEDAISATLAAMNAIAQEATKTAVMAATRITETGIQKTGQSMKDYLPSVVREHQVSSALRADNPLMKDPQYSPMVEAVNLQMARQFPQATADQIKQYTVKYFDDMVNKIAAGGNKQVVNIADMQKAAGIMPQTDFSGWEQ